jgi:cell wall-associated NlpC family hydrolase
MAVVLCIPLGNASAQSVLDQTVSEYIGTRYKTAGATTSGFDCSGFTMFIFKQFDIALPHQSKSQSKVGNWVDKSQLREGDLVFFNTDGVGISHVGIYLGNDVFIHSASNVGIVKTNINDKYYKARYVSASRVLTDEQYEQLMTEAM